MTNDLHTTPFRFLEDVYGIVSQQDNTLGTQLIREVVATAQVMGWYKLIATSRSSRQKVYELYRRLWFQNYGIEFRMNFDLR